MTACRSAFVDYTACGLDARHRVVDRLRAVQFIGVEVEHRGVGLGQLLILGGGPPALGEGQGRGGSQGQKG